MIVVLDADGVVVQEPHDLDVVRLRTELDPDAARTALQTTGSGVLEGEHAQLDLAVLRSRAELLVDDPGWGDRWAEMVNRAEREGRLSADRRWMRL